MNTAGPIILGLIIIAMPSPVVVIILALVSHVV